MEIGVGPALGKEGVGVRVADRFPADPLPASVGIPVVADVRDGAGGVAVEAGAVGVREGGGKPLVLQGAVDRHEVATHGKRFGLLAEPVLTSQGQRVFVPLKGMPLVGLAKSEAWQQQRQRRQGFDVHFAPIYRLTSEREGDLKSYVLRPYERSSCRRGRTVNNKQFCVIVIPLH